MAAYNPWARGEIWSVAGDTGASDSGRYYYQINMGEWVRAPDPSETTVTSGTVTLTYTCGHIDDNNNCHVVHSETRLVKHSEAWRVAREMAIQGTMWMLQQHAQDCDWLAVLLLLWELVRLSMLAGRWLSSSQSEDGKALLWALAEGVTP